jgi:hypothetical protein
MKRFLSSVALCLLLLLVGLFFFMPSTEAQNGVLPALLSLPAPPPPNPFYRPTSTERDESFYDKKTPPADDAPIGDLLDYWKHQNQFDPKYTYRPKPSEKSVERLMAEVEKKPETLAELVDTLPETPETSEFVKRLYDEESNNRKFDASWRTGIKKWLTYHTNYFTNDLYQIANQAADTKEYVTNQDEVLALARVDWERAKPILDRMLSNSQQPVSQTLARWANYQHALAVNDSFDIDKYRKELQETVENKSLQPGNRDLAMDALVEAGDFPGRDEWYYSLLEDETLYELKVNGQVYTGLTTLLNHSPDDRYVAKMIELVGSSNQTVRNAAVRNLSTLLDDGVTKQNPEIIKALLPWLENPKWAKEVSGERMKILTALRSIYLPESVPGLIALLNEKERQEISSTANTNAAVYSNRPVITTNANVNGSVYRQQTVESYPYRSWAIMALEKQRSPQAAAALRSVLPVVEQWERQNVVRALLVSNGFTVAEQVDALEAVAKNYEQQPETNYNSVVTNSAVSDLPLQGRIASNMANVTYVDTVPSYRAQPFDLNDLKMVLGQQLVSIDDPGDELVKAVIDRINFLEKKNPQTAAGLRQIIQNWKGAAINALLLRDLRDGKSNISAILRLLVLRKEMREKQLNDVTDIRAGSQTALGISACLLEQPADYEAILDSGSDESKTAMLGCARLIRAQLPLQKVAENLKSQNKLLALAAERYLETEDSPPARQMVLALHPNEAKILGARMAFIPENSSAAGFLPMTRDLFVSVDSSFEKLPTYFFYNDLDSDSIEKKLQAEVKENQELLGIYSYDNNYVRIYKDKAVYSYQDDPARYRERALSFEEFEALKNFLAQQRVDELPPFLSVCEGCEGKELLMLGRGGGRRVFVKAEPQPEFFAELENIFAEFRKQPAQIHYYLEKDIPGLEVLFADDNLGAETLWKDGADFRVAIDDLTVRKQNEKEAEENAPDENYEEEEEPDESDENEVITPEKKAEMEKERKENQRLARQKQYGSYSWYKFDRTKLLEPVAQPPLVEFVPLVDGFAVQPGDEQWKARAANVEVRSDEDGLYKIKGGQMTKIGSGYYYHPLVTPNGRWAIVTKYSQSEDENDSGLVRVNLLTNREFKVKVESEYGTTEPVAFIAALNKVLLFSSYGEGETELSQRSGEFFLLDAETGFVQPLKSDAYPLLQQTFRSLQPVAALADSFWAAVPDAEKNATAFGIYNARTLSFKPLLNIPQITFNSMNMWIDEREGKIYFVYGGQLLALPLPKNR